ncbi:MAG: hypothetical protein HC785_09795 [Calothrix sp. CSU_2_0]|nr:hypothetical protein [Calothrix sp. CSU_2_0]
MQITLRITLILFLINSIFLPAKATAIAIKNPDKNSLFTFINPNGDALFVPARSVSANNGDDKPCVSDLLASTCETPELVQTTNIQDGNYITEIGLGIDPRIGLEVQGNQYRYYDEYEKKEWRDIRELKSIEPGLIFDDNQYWCNPPNHDDGVCTENGWERYQNLGYPKILDFEFWIILAQLNYFTN